MSAYDKVLQARSKNRPVAVDYINGIFKGFTELHGDRFCGDDASVVGGIAYLGNMPVTVIGIEKGKETSDKIFRNFGAAHPEGYRKALRLAKQAEKFSRPVVMFVDTAGAFCGIDAEEHGQGQAIAKCLADMMVLKTPTLSIIIGEGGSGGAIALAVANEVWMVQGAYYSVVSPEGCANILWKDAGKASLAAEYLKITADELLSFGIIERTISEPFSFDERSSEKYFDTLAEDIKCKLDELMMMDNENIISSRYEKYRKIGRYNNSGI